MCKHARLVKVTDTGSTMNSNTYQCEDCKGLFRVEITPDMIFVSRKE